MTSFTNYLDLIRFFKPIGTTLLLWPSLIALFLAEKKMPDIKLIGIFCLGAFLARSAGCIINDIADHDFDYLVKRTKDRPITSGKISLKNAWLAFASLVCLLFILVLQLNWFTIGLSFIALFLLVIYPFSKRFFVLPQFFLAFTYGFSTLMAFSAVHNQFVWHSLLVYALSFIWIFYFDTLYALVDLKDDLKIKIHTSAIFLADKVFISLYILQILIFLGIIGIGFYFALNLKYYLSLIIIALILAYQYYLIRQKNEQSYFKAFLNNHYLGFFWFLATILGIY